MSRKVLIPVLVAAAVLLGGIGAWWLLRDTPQGNAGNNPDRLPGKQSTTNLAERDYDPAVVQPDPIERQNPTPFRVQENNYRMEVAGRVVNSAGIAVVDACVTFIGEGTLLEVNGAGYTDATGRYRLVALSSRGPMPPAGQRKCRVAAEGTEGGYGVSPTVDLPSDDSVTMPDVVIAAGAEIRGRVKDQDGAPVTGAGVSARSMATFEMIPEGLRSQRVQHRFVTCAATTDDLGEFRIPGLLPGKYRVDVERSYFGLQTDSAETDAQALSPNWLELTVTARDWLRGVVRDGQNQPMAGVVVRAESTSGPEEGSGLRIADPPKEGFRDKGERPVDRSIDPTVRRGGFAGVTDFQGRFAFHALRGPKWRLSARVGDSEAILEDVPLNQADNILVLAAQTWLTGVVRNAETNEPVKFFDLRLVLGAEAPSPFERARADGAYPLRPYGEFRVANPKGNRLRVTAPGFAPAAMEIAPLKPGESRTGMDIALAPLCRLTLTLAAEGQKLEVEPVFLLAENNVVDRCTSDVSGRVLFPSLAPGRYQLVVQRRDGTRVGVDVDVPARARAALELGLTPLKDR